MKYGQLKLPAITSAEQCFRDSEVTIHKLRIVFRDFIEITATHSTDRIDREPNFKDIVSLKYASTLSRKYFETDLINLKTFENE